MVNSVCDGYRLLGPFKSRSGISFACLNRISYDLAPGLLARNIFMWSNAAQLLNAILWQVRSQPDCYEFSIKGATLAVLFYIGLTDLRRFKIHNLSLGFLLLLYALYAAAARSLNDIAFDLVLSAVVFAVLIWFYSKGAVGGGDVKLLPIACLWVGSHCAALFSLLLLVFMLIHLAAVKVGWAEVRHSSTRWTIPYAPSICGAVAFAILTSCF